jgi:DNA replication protein DnaC
LPVPTCPKCRGERYVIDRSGERCLARACGCGQECTDCGGSGRVYLEKDGYTYVKACACRSTSQRVLLFNQARLPSRCGLTFEGFVPTNEEQAKAQAAAVTTARRYRPEAPSKGFLVAGPVGSGKTHLLCATLRHLTLELGVSARYVEISFLFSEIRKGFGDNRSGLDAILPLVDADVLALDELGKGRGSPFEMDTLDELIARRYNANRTTLFATNFMLEAEPSQGGGFVAINAGTASRPASSELLLRDRVGERIYSRLHEMCHLIQFPQATEDWRRRDAGGR